MLLWSTIHKLCTCTGIGFKHFENIAIKYSSSYLEKVTNEGSSSWEMNLKGKPKMTKWPKLPSQNGHKKGAVDKRSLKIWPLSGGHIGCSRITDAQACKFSALSNKLGTFFKPHFYVCFTHFSIDFHFELMFSFQFFKCYYFFLLLVLSLLYVNC